MSRFLRAVYASTISAACVCSGHARAADAPSYDTETHCSEVADSIGGSAQIELTCRQEESKARRWVESHSVSDKMMTYCDEVASTLESYEILKTCIEQEQEAAAQL